ncbi:TonB-dependent receptor [uncultured Paraglaciecola sp.]|uniref:TonB-dependent receptor n=1 Tax=uncultured Paraglaciecola sp. TaxID=1765024 RepID=UPI0030D82A1D
MTERVLNTKKKQNQICLTLSLISLATSSYSLSIQAQEANAEENLETIAVTGSRLQNQKSINTKRLAVGVIDTISQDEIGKQPDFNIADAVRRAAGVSTVRDEEEGLFLSVRGLNPDFTLVTMDGGALASSDFSALRRVSVEAMPATVIQRTDIIKTRSAETDGNTIGGQVNFVTRSAFDTDKLFATLSGSIGQFTADQYDRVDNKPAIKLDGTIADTFGNQAEFGYVFAGSYFRRDQDEQRALNYYNSDYSVPTFSVWNGIENPMERLGGFAKFEYRANEQLSMELSGRYFEQNETFVRASTVMWGSTNNLILNDTNSGTITSAGGDLETLITHNGKKQYGFNYSSEYKLNDDTVVDLRASYAYGEATDGDAGRSDTTFDYIGAAGGLDYHYAFNENGMPPQYTYLNPELAENLDNYALSTVETDTVVNDGTVFDMETNLQHYFGGSGFDLKTGLRYRRTERSYDPNNIDIKYIGDSPLLLSQFATLSSQYRPPYAPINSPIIDNAAIIAYKMANPALFNDVTNQDNLLSSDFEIAEKVFAGYASLGYQNDELQAHAGLRVEKTDLLTDAYARTNGILAPIQGKNDYTNLLPSAGLTYDLSQDIKIRANYAKALGRPNFPDLNPARTLTESAGITTIKEGNSKLDPRVADNVDLSFEYYFDEGRSLASVALFYKDIKDEIFTLQTQTTQNNAPVITTHPLNASDATLKGLELNLIKDRLDFLPGFLSDFGVSVNYTFIKADATVLATDGSARQVDFLTEQPRNLANAALFYQQGDFEGRLSYNLTGRYAASINPTNPDSDDFIDDFDTIDAQFRWQFNQNFTLMVEGRNLTNEKNVRLTGPNRSRNEDYSVFGKAYFVGLTYHY